MAQSGLIGLACGDIAEKPHPAQIRATVIAQPDGVSLQRALVLELDLAVVAPLRVRIELTNPALSATFSAASGRMPPSDVAPPLPPLEAICSPEIRQISRNRRLKEATRPWPSTTSMPSGDASWMARSSERSNVALSGIWPYPECLQSLVDGDVPPTRVAIFPTGLPSRQAADKVVLHSILGDVGPPA